MSLAEARQRPVPIGLPALAFLCVLAARFPVLIAHQDTWYPFEVHSGTIARAILDRVPVEISHLPIVPHIRGGVLFGVLLVPFYALFGTSVFVMKLLPLLWNAASVALLVRVLEIRHRRASAIAATVLFVFAPPMLSKLSVIGLASHLESMLPFMWTLLLVLGGGVFSATRALLLGLVVGFAGFFHLQALLPALLALCLALPSLLRSGKSAIALCVVGIAVAAAPSWLFAGGNLGLLGVSLGGKADVEPGTTALHDSNPPPLEKLEGLVSHDYAYALEFGDLSQGSGLAIGIVFACATFLLAIRALYSERGAIVDYLRSAISSPPRPPPLGLVFACHILLVVALYLVSHAHHQDDIGAGLSNRHLAPVYFSALALAACGLGCSIARASRVVVAALLLASPSIAALPKIAAASPATRVPLRGECYEWFIGPMHSKPFSRPVDLLNCIRRVDTGGPRWRPLRFQLEMNLHGAATLSVPLEIANWSRIPEGVKTFSAVDSGRRLAMRDDLILDPAVRSALDSMDTKLAPWFYRGIGLGIELPRLADPGAAQEHFHARVLRVLRIGDTTAAARILEGLGFHLGSVFEPYNSHLAQQLRELVFVPAEFRDSLYRGLGWGARQRYRSPPTAIPEGLAMLELVPDANKPAFERGFLGQDGP